MQRRRCREMRTVSQPSTVGPFASSRSFPRAAVTSPTSSGWRIPQRTTPLFATPHGSFWQAEIFPMRLRPPTAGSWLMSTKTAPFRSTRLLVGLRASCRPACWETLCRPSSVFVNRPWIGLKMSITFFPPLASCLRHGVGETRELTTLVVGCWSPVLSLWRGSQSTSVARPLK